MPFKSNQFISLLKIHHEFQTFFIYFFTNSQYNKLNIQPVGSPLVYLKRNESETGGAAYTPGQLID